MDLFIEIKRIADRTADDLQNTDGCRNFEDQYYTWQIQFLYKPDLLVF